MAHEFLNYLLQPEVAARLAFYSKYATPNAKAMPLLDEADRSNEGIYPPQELIPRMEYFRDVSADSRLYEETWTIVKTR